MKHHFLTWLPLAALLSMAACSSGGDSRVPDMPPFRNADGFLQMQQKADRFRKSDRNVPSVRHPFTAKNERIFRNVERNRQIAISEKQYRDSIREQNIRRARNEAQRDFKAYQDRLVQAELAAVEREIAISGTSRNRFQRRFDNFQGRLEELVREREREAMVFDTEKARLQNNLMRDFQSRVNRLAEEKQANDEFLRQRERERQEQLGGQILGGQPQQEQSQ